jgi:hypothetical protein
VGGLRRELRAPLAPGGRVDLACKGAQQLRSAGLGVVDGRVLHTRSVAGACGSSGRRELRLRPALEWRRTVRQCVVERGGPALWVCGCVAA